MCVLCSWYTLLLLVNDIKETWCNFHHLTSCRNRICTCIRRKIAWQFFCWLNWLLDFIYNQHPPPPRTHNYRANLHLYYTPVFQMTIEQLQSLCVIDWMKRILIWNTARKKKRKNTWIQINSFFLWKWLRKAWKIYQKQTTSFLAVSFLWGEIKIKERTALWKGEKRKRRES